MAVELSLAQSRITLHLVHHQDHLLATKLDTVAGTASVTELMSNIASLPIQFADLSTQQETC